MRSELPILNDGHINRCFHMRYSNSYSTCFLHSFDNKVAFVTAAHSLKGAVVGDRVLIRKNLGWVSLKISALEENEVQDISVFTLEKFVISHAWEEPKIEIFLGQPVIYLGFPHSLSGDYPGQMDMATPLAKVAHFSGNIEHNGAKLVILDGLNNPGFSGGPIFHKQSISDPAGTGLIGIVHGYRYEQDEKGRVYAPSGVDGKTPKPTEYFVRMNSGMILASSRIYIENLFSRLTDGLIVAPSRLPHE